MMLRVVNRAKGQLEYIYELTTKTLDKNRKNGKDTIELLRSIDGVYRVKSGVSKMSRQNNEGKQTTEFSSPDCFASDRRLGHVWSSDDWLSVSEGSAAVSHKTTDLSDKRIQAGSDFNPEEQLRGLQAEQENYREKELRVITHLQATCRWLSLIQEIRSRNGAWYGTADSLCAN